ncbi:MAG: carboxypeptidase regulatory-like domain-containing protein [Planctomycetes bacterium]|nr:carboxypeptidase regulatory-like domain-containing protein [Planctomycetota bacterium]
MFRSDRLLLTFILMIVILLLVGYALTGRRSAESDLEQVQDRDRVERLGPGRNEARGMTPTTAAPEEAGAAPAGEDEEPEVAAASLELEFRCTQPERGAGIVVRLLPESSGPGGAREATSDESGRVVFADLRPGRYRWQHDGSRAIDPVPPNESAPVTFADDRLLVRGGEDRRSGPIELREGETRHIIVPFLPGALVSGRIVDARGIVAGSVAIKLLTRERSQHPAGTVVDRLLVGRAATFPSGEFRFEDVRPGLIELLGYWHEDDGVSQVRLDFEIAAGETRDLGELSARDGRDLTIELRPVDREGRPIAPEVLFGRAEVYRVVELLPLEPDGDWPYQKLELALGKPYHVRGLPAATCRFRLAMEDETVNPPAAGFVRIEGRDPVVTAEQDLLRVDEVWGRLARLRLSLPEEVEERRWLMLLVDLDTGRARREAMRLGRQTLEIELPAGRHRLLLLELGEGGLAADSGELRVGEEGLDLVLHPRPGGLIDGRQARVGRGSDLRLEPLDLTGIEEILLPFDQDGRLRLALPPGRYRRYDGRGEILVVAGESLDLGAIAEH